MNRPTKEQARELIGKAWRIRYETIEEPPTDPTTLSSMVERVETALVRACGICRRIGAYGELSIALGKLGHVEQDRNRPDRALRFFEAAVAAAREAGDKFRLAHTVRHLGQVHHHERRLDEARRCYEEALVLYGRDEAAPSLDYANALAPTAALQEEFGDLDRARILWSKAAALYRSVGVVKGAEECETRIARL